MAMKYYVDGAGNYLGGWEEGHPDTPIGMTEIPSPPVDARQQWISGEWTEVPAEDSPANSDFFFNSGEIDITSGGFASLQHGLRRAPDITQITLLCKSTNAGYSAGDEVNIGFMDGMKESGGQSKDSGVVFIADHTDITFQYGSDTNVFRVLQKNNGNTVTLNNSKWKMIIKAYLL